MKRRVFDRQFKMESVRLASCGDMTISKTARALNISTPTLYRWMSEWDRDKENAFPGRGSPVIDSQFEINELQKKIAYLEQKNSGPS